MFAMTKLCVTVLSVLAASQTANCCDNRPNLEGDWRVTYFAHDGKVATAEQIKTFIARFRGTTVKFSGTPNEVDARFQLEVKEGVTFMSISPTNGHEKDKRHDGILLTDGKFMLLCVASPGAQPPTRFSAAAGSKCTIFSMMREKLQDVQDGK